MLNNTLIYVIVFLLGTTGLFYGISKYKDYQLEASRRDIKDLKTKSVIKDEEFTVKNFEDNQSITFKIEKGVKIEEIPSTIGTHTINVRD